MAVGRRHKGRDFVVSVAFAFFVPREKMRSGGSETQLEWNRKNIVKHQWILLQDDVPFTKGLLFATWDQDLLVATQSDIWWHLGLGDVDLGSCFLAFKVGKKPPKNWVPHPKKLQGFLKQLFRRVSKLRNDWSYFQITKNDEKPKELSLGS